jgi:hypothetical protein
MASHARFDMSRKEGTVCVPKRNGVPPALKHGAYAKTTILPGEDPAAFKKLFRDLVEEFDPDGPIEMDIVLDIARLIWRKRNLGTFRIAEFARAHYEHIREQSLWDEQVKTVDPARMQEANKAADAVELRAEKELGHALEFVENKDLATFDGLTKELHVEAQLNAMIDKSLKRLLLVRGVKSMSPSSLPALPRAMEGPRNPDA